MKLSDEDAVQNLYDETAESYSRMMDSEIELPLYADTLGRLHKRIDGLPGTIVDTACGSGHMLAMYRQRYDSDRPLLGIDLSPQMVAIARQRVGPDAELLVGDMRDLSQIDGDTAIAVLSYFSLHHVDVDGIREALGEWLRVLRPDGQLLIAAWEGSGAIDYGSQSDVIAVRYGAQELSALVRDAGFAITSCKVEVVDEIPMDAIYLEATKA